MNLLDRESAVKTLKRGLPIIFPTDTLPAIGCLPEFSNIIYKFKKRDKNKPLILMGSEEKQLIDYVHESAKEDYKNVASNYWPGALTMVIPSSEKQTLILTSKDLTLGLRIPNSYIAQSLIKEIIQKAPLFLKEKGWLILENHFDQGEKVKQLLLKNKFTSIEIVNDLSGIGRFTIGRYK